MDLAAYFYGLMKALRKRRLSALLQLLHCVEDGRRDLLVPNYGVDHQVIERARRPVGAEIVFHKLNAVTINRVNQIFGFAQAGSVVLNAAQLFSSRCV